MPGRNNELYKTIIIDINKLDRNLTNLQNTSISKCTINTTAQPVNDIIRDENTTELMNEPENKELVINETNKNTEQVEPEEGILDVFNK